MSNCEGKRTAAQAAGRYDSAGELFMLAWLARIPASPEADDLWQTRGTSNLPDGSTVRHEKHGYYFTHDGHDHPTQTRPTAMDCAHRPRRRLPSEPATVQSHINQDGRFNRSAWPLLCELRESSSLTIAVHGQVSPETATLPSKDGDAAAIMGVSHPALRGSGSADTQPRLRAEDSEMAIMICLLTMQTGLFFWTVGTGNILAMVIAATGVGWVLGTIIANR